MVQPGQDHFTPVGSFIDKAKVPEPHGVELFCSVNGTERQRGHTKERGKFGGNPGGKP